MMIATDGGGVMMIATDGGGVMMITTDGGGCDDDSDRWWWL